MAILIAGSDVARLANVLVFNRVAPPVSLSAPPLPSRLGGRWTPRVLAGLKVAVIALMMWRTAWRCSVVYRERAAQPSSYRGTFEVLSLTSGGETVAQDAPRRWTLISLYAHYAIVWFPAGKYEGFDVDGEASADRITLKSRVDGDQNPNGTAVPEEMRVVLSAAGEGSVTGTFDGKPVAATLRRKKEEPFTLVSRGFHWVSEHPYVK
jgi:hypothetical protein